MRERIKALAEHLFVQRSVRGVSFGDLAEELQITRANIHYHFGNKEALVEEVVDDYVDATLQRLQEIWTDERTTFDEKIKQVVKHSRERYRRFNPAGQAGNAWSLLTRMRQDLEVLTPRGRAALKRFTDTVRQSVERGLEIAIARGEFTQDLPVSDVALHFLSISNGASPTTQDLGSFEALARLYTSFAEILRRAYGTGPALPVH